MHYLSFLDNLIRDLCYALRNLRKDQRFTIVAVFALALGIGASTVVFGVFYNLVFNAFAAKDASQFVVLVMQDAERPGDERSLSVPFADLDVKPGSELVRGFLGRPHNMDAFKLWM